MTPFETFERIKELAKKHGLSLIEVNDKAGLGTRSIYHWNKTNPSTNNLKAVAAVAVSVLGADLVKQLLCHIFLGDVAVDLALGVQVTALTQGDHLLGHRTHVLGTGHSGLDLAIL